MHIFGKQKNMQIKTAIILLVFILGGLFYYWWLSGPRVANDFSQISQSLLKDQMNLPHAWSTRGTEGLGEYTAFTLWSWPYNFLQGIFANLNLPFDLLQRIFFIIPFLIIGSLGIWKLCENLNLSNNAKIIATLFYLTNTYILLVIDGGQLSISLAYAIFPLAFYFFERAMEGDFKKRILAGLTISSMGFFDIRFLYVFLVLGLLSFSYNLLFSKTKKRLFLNWVKTGLVISIITLGLNAYWVLLLIKYPLSSDTYALLTQTSFTSFISLTHALSLFSPNWFKNVYGNVAPVQFEFIILPILVFLAPILKRKDKMVGFWLVIAIFSVFLTKGAAEPLPEVYQWLYNRIPGFSLFRDSSKFFFLVALSYSLLIGVSLDEVIKKVKSYKIKIGFTVALIIFLVVLIKPIYLGLMTGTFSAPIFQKEYSALNRIITDDKTFSNILWIPTISPSTILNPDHPALEASRLAQKRPFVQANIGTYEMFNFLREAQYMGELLDVANIGYIAYPPLDVRRADLHPDNIRYYDIFLNQLSNLPWLARVEDSPIPLLKVNRHQDKLFAAPNIWVVLGSDNLYSEATKSAKLSLSKNTLIFLDQSPNLYPLLDQIPQAKIVLQDKGVLDLKASLIDEKELVFPARQLNNDPNFSGWWKRETASMLSFKDFLLTKYGIFLKDFDLGGGWAISEGDLKLNIQDGKIKKGQMLLARVMESSQSGKISFYQKDKLIGEINTKNNNSNIKWFEVGFFTENNDLEIKSEGKINLINALAMLSENKWQEYGAKVSSYQNRIVKFEENSAKEEAAKISYKQINPTKYIVSIDNLTNPQALVFAHNFDNKWKLDNQSSFPAYSFLNGFSIEKNGQYILEYEPQKYIPVGLIISLATAVIIFALLLI